MSSTAAAVTSETISSAVLGAATARANSAIRAAKAKFVCSDIQVYWPTEQEAKRGQGISLRPGAQPV